MWRLPTLSPRFLAATISCLASPIVLLFLSLDIRASPQSLRPRQQLHSILSQAVLSPALRSPEVSLRYSPDGKFLLFQDPSGVTVLAVNPLSIVFHIYAEDVYPAQFSADSLSITMVTRGLSFGRWRLPDGQKIISGDLPVKEYCLDGQLSPDGQFFACATPDFRFALYDISAQKSVFEDSIAGASAPFPGGIRSGAHVSFVSFSSLDTNSAFAGPFGLVRTSVPMPSPSRSLSFSAIHFSPDGKVLIARALRGSFGLDITARKKFALPGALEKAMSGAIALQSSERAVAMEKGKRNESVILSLKNGKVLADPVFVADRIHIASNPRYLILYNASADGQSAGAFDLEQNHLVETPPNASMDVHGEEMAVYSIGGLVALYRLGERRLLANLHLPLSELPALRSASIAPNLENLAISVNGAGAIFRVSTGQRVASFPKFSAVNFLGQSEAILFLPNFHEVPARMLRVDTSTGTSSSPWEIGKGFQIYAGGPVLLEYSFEKEMTRALWDFPMPKMQIPYRLRALDPASGGELWKRDFSDDPPTPFADPQGERLVLGWQPKSSGAKDAAKHDSTANALYKNAKLNDHDSYFEALDARTGKSVGGVLVQVGVGVTSFDSAFSVGDAMVLMKDGMRISLYSMRDGQLKARLVGVRPSASEQSNLLVVDHGSGTLGFYDLRSGAKLVEQIFPDRITYTRFSADGKRLFVLTEHQAAVVLDVSKVREKHDAVPQTNEEKN